MLAALFAPISRRPLLVLLLLWVAGILLATSLHLPWGYWAVASLPLLVAWLLTQSTNTRVPRPALAGAMLCLGAGVTAWQMVPTLGDLFNLPGSNLAITGYTLSPASETAPGGWQLTFRVTARLYNGSWQPANGDILLLGRGNPPGPGQYCRAWCRVLPAEAEAGNPFGFSWQRYLQARGLQCTCSARSLQMLPRQAPLARVYALRAFLDRRLAIAMPGAYGQLNAQLLGGLVLGLHGVEMSEQQVENFRRAGIIHLMVVSGSQVTLFAGLLLFPLWLASRGRARTTYPRLRAVLLLLSLPLLACYVLLADRGPSVDRAVLMVLLGTLSLFLAFSPLARQRSFSPDMLTLLAAAALVMLICRPMLLFSPGAQLSFAAVLGLITATPVLMRALHRLLGPIALLPAATLGAQAMTAPVLAWNFGTVSLIGALANLIAVPVVGILMPLGLLTFICAAIAPPAAVMLNLINQPLLAVLLNTSTFAARVPWAEMAWPLHSVTAATVYYALLAAALLGLSRFLDRFAPEWQIPAGREPRMW